MTPGDEEGESASDPDGADTPGEGDADDASEGGRDSGRHLDPIGDDTVGTAGIEWLDAAPEVPDVVSLGGQTASIGGDGETDGRYVCARRPRTDVRASDVALDATLRATAQRGGTTVGSQDIRTKRRERETPALVVFAVDASMSMRAHGDIRTATELATGVLRRANRRNDYVAVVAFRDERGDVIVPPTDDRTVATSQLDDITVGNRTPLPAGLLAADRLIARERKAIPDLPAVVVVLTDGRPTVGIEDDPVAETNRLAHRLGTADVDLVVLDLDRGTSGTDVCRSMAAAADGEYVSMADIAPADRTRIVTRVLESVR
ncbi:MAG: VWA domain-containing protein [Halorhabdus sp.]